MADPAAAAVQTPGPAAAAPTAPAPAPGRGGPNRAERRAAAFARMQRGGSAEMPAAAPAGEKPTLQEAATAAPSKPAEVAPPAPAADHKPTAPAEPAEPDPATERGLRAVEQARKKLLDEQNAWKTERELQVAELAQLRKQAEGKVASREDLRKLRGADLLDALDHLDEDDYDIIARTAYARTKAGQTDPRAQAAAQEARRAQGSRAAAGEVEGLKARIEELEANLTGEFTRRDQASFAERWVGEAVKAIPADKPTFLAKLHANEPDTAKRELLAIGAELEKANGGEPPTHAEVIAEFEKRERARLKSRGIDADTLLAPPKAAEPAAKPPARTLDPAAATLTRPENAPKTRDEKRDRALANLRARQRATADQQ